MILLVSDNIDEMILVNEQTSFANEWSKDLKTVFDTYLTEDPKMITSYLTTPHTPFDPKKVSFSVTVVLTLPKYISYDEFVKQYPEYLI